MAAKSRALSSAAGWLAGFYGELEEALLERGCTDEEIHSLVTRKPRPKLAIGVIADAVASLIKAAKNVFRLIHIGDGRTTEELVRDDKYNFANSNITSANFPARARKQKAVEIVLIEFDHDATSEEAIAEATRLGLKRPTYEDALYFGVEHPEVQRERPVLFLHEPWLGPDGRGGVLYLRGDASSRELYLHWFVDLGSRYDRFAFVRKPACQ